MFLDLKTKKNLFKITVIHDISKQIEQRARIGKIFAKIIELIEGITIMSTVLRQGNSILQRVNNGALQGGSSFI